MPQASRMASYSVRLLVVGSLAVTDIAGCANGGNLFASSVDPSDACGIQHRDFADSRNYWFSEAASGAITGAFTGAATGALLAWASGRNVGQGAAYGAGAGAVIGASAKYYEAKQKQASDQAALTNSIYDDVRKASVEYDRVSTTFAAVNQCRRQRLALIRAEYKQGTLTRQQATEQGADMQKRWAAEVVLAKQYGQKMADQDGSFKYAAASLATDDPAAQTALTTKHTKAVYHPPSSATGYTINTAANVRKAPDASSERLAGLFAGASVEPEGDPESGWQKIKFNGGTEGYVLAKFVAKPGDNSVVASSGKSKSKSPTSPAPTPTADTTPPPSTATPAETPPSDNPDKKVAIAETVTETISEKRESYDKSVASADSDSAVAFNVDQPAPG